MPAYHTCQARRDCTAKTERNMEYLPQRGTAVQKWLGNLCVNASVVEFVHTTGNQFKFSGDSCAVRSSSNAFVYVRLAVKTQSGRLLVPHVSCAAGARRRQVLRLHEWACCAVVLRTHFQNSLYRQVGVHPYPWITRLAAFGDGPRGGVGGTRCVRQCHTAQPR